MKSYFFAAICLLSLAAFNVSAESECPSEIQKNKMVEALNAAKNECVMDSQKRPEYQARWDDSSRSCISRGLTGRSLASAQYYFDLSDCSAIKLMYRTATSIYVYRVIPKNTDSTSTGAQSAMFFIRYIFASSG